MKKLMIALLLAFYLIPTSFTQQSDDKEIFLDGEYFMMLKEYRDALPFYLQLIGKYPDNANLNYRIGMCYLNIQGQKDKSIPHFQEAVKNLTSKYRGGNFKEEKAPYDTYFSLANAYLINNELNKAKKIYEKYLNYLDPGDTININFVKKKIESCQNAKQLEENKIYFDYFNLGDNINSADDNFQAEVSENGNSMVYMTGLKFYNAIYHSKKVNGKWTPPVNLSPQVKSDGNLFVSSLSADGKTLYMTKNDNFNSDIYVSYFNDSIWSEAEKLDNNINTKYWESHASESHDGSTLYFSSSKIEGYGGMDIYKSEKNQLTGEWSEPVNLGDAINTPFNEDCPFLTKDGKRLYFSSQGHNTMGGFDIFYSVKSDSNTWTKPVNIGCLINSTDDDIFFTPFNEGNGAFYSMFGLEDSYGKDDIYYLNIFSDRNPRKVKIKGTVIAPGIASEKDGEINVDILEETTSTKIGSAKPEISTGKFDYTLSKPGKYQIIASAEGYADSKKDFSLPSDYSKAEIIINARLKPEKKEEIVLPVVFFDFDKFSIREKETYKIDDLFQILSNNKTLKLEIRGYTDFIGNYDYNKKLGKKRSSEIVKALVSKGIEKERLEISSGGEDNPIAINKFPDGSDSPEGRQFNRRAVPIILQSENKLIIPQKIIIPDKLKISD